MSSKDLSAYASADVPSASGKKFGIVVSQWNSGITRSLFLGAFDTLVRHGAKKENIFRKDVPGSFELPLAAQLFAKEKKVNAVICLGCIIRGETPHFDYIAQAVAKGIMDVSLTHNIPVVFGVLTTDNEQQALERAGGKLGNKGTEAAITAIRMAELKKSFRA